MSREGCSRVDDRIKNYSVVTLSSILLLPLHVASNISSYVYSVSFCTFFGGYQRLQISHKYVNISDLVKALSDIK